MLTIPNSDSDLMMLQIRIKYPLNTVAPVNECGDPVYSFRITWRMNSELLARAWTDIVPQRHLCDQIVSRTTSLQMFVSCISGVKDRMCRGEARPIYPAVSYWVVTDGAGAGGGAELATRLSAACPLAQIKLITSFTQRQREDPLAAHCSRLFVVLKDHNSGFVNQKIRSSVLDTGTHDVVALLASNAKLNMTPDSKYMALLPASVPVLKAGGLCIDLRIWDETDTEGWPTPDRGSAIALLCAKKKRCAIQSVSGR